MKELPLWVTRIEQLIKEVEKELKQKKPAKIKNLH